MPRWRQDAKTLKLIPIDDSKPRSAGAVIFNDIEPFKSPIDGSIISDRKQLREHNKKHNVVQASEFSPEYYERKANERADLLSGTSKVGKADRIEAIKHALYKHGVR